MIETENQPDDVDNVQRITKDSTFWFKDEVDETVTPELINIFRNDLESFLLNNVLMSFQFFENYQRDINRLQDRCFEFISLPTEHKKCFFDGSVFRLVGDKVKYLPRHGKNKNIPELLRPINIYISNDNVIAAFDPSVFFSSQKPDIRPYYQFTVETSERANNKEKPGFVKIVEYKTLEQLEEEESEEPKFSNESGSVKFRDSVRESIRVPFRQRFSVKRTNSVKFAQRNSRRLTATEKILAQQNMTPESVKLEVRSILKNSVISSEEMIPKNVHYNYVKPDDRLKPVPVYTFKMNNVPKSSLHIPRACFQMIDVKTNNKRRNALSNCFTTKILLNSSGYKGHFCDLLIVKLAEHLNFDSSKINEGMILGECISFYREDDVCCVVPGIEIKDWKNCIKINKSQVKSSTNLKRLEWPTSLMMNIINLLPCTAVPIGSSKHLEENLDYEKEWKILFPKAEEFLLLHMMHAHLRCYFFVLIIYKTFIECEIHTASFGPRHILHLLFWRVQKDFKAWPEDRPGETLIIFLKVLYKKLQRKFLPDFFLPSRNLFGDSHPKDLHKAQAIIKMIVDNPVPYVLRALRNLDIDRDFFDTFDLLKLYKILSTKQNAKKKPKKKNDETNKSKTVRFQDEELEWKKTVFRQIQKEKKIEEREMMRKLSIETINAEEYPAEFKKLSKYNEILIMFISHFVEMGIKCLQYKCKDQALMYIFQIEKLLRLIPEHLFKQQDLKDILNKASELKNKYDGVKTLMKAKKSTAKTLPEEENNILTETRPIEIVDKDQLKETEEKNDYETNVDDMEDTKL